MTSKIRIRKDLIKLEYEGDTVKYDNPCLQHKNNNNEVNTDNTTIRNTTANNSTTNNNNMNNNKSINNNKDKIAMNTDPRLNSSKNAIPKSQTSNVSSPDLKPVNADMQRTAQARISAEEQQQHDDRVKALKRRLVEEQQEHEDRVKALKRRLVEEQQQYEDRVIVLKRRLAEEQQQYRVDDLQQTKELKRQNQFEYNISKAFQTAAEEVSDMLLRKAVNNISRELRK